MHVVDGRYELRERLGRGGMAEVFAAYDARLGRSVALKILSADVTEPRARERFEREVLTHASFVHPNAVAIFDTGIDGSRPYLVMELVDGPTLATYLARHGPLPVGTAVAVTSGVLAALDAAHRRGIVHRDVKPSNVLLGDDGRVRLVDFGIAKPISDLTADLTATGQIVGTASYLAPELARGAPATPASDLYAVGVMLFEMLTGEIPLRGDTPIATLTARDRAAPPSARALRPDIPTGLDAAMLRALARDPAERFGSAREMQAAITAAAEPTVAFDGDPTLPSPAPPPAARASRRRRRAVPIALASALVAGGAAAWVVAAASPSATPSSSPAVTTTTVERVTTVPPRDSTPPTTSPRPRTLGELVSALAAGGSRYGSREEALRLALLRLLDGKPRDVSKRAAELARQVTRWASAGELDPVIAGTATQLLASLVSTPEKHGEGRD
ncbi:MAG TPA: protein kinase [Acidimicrobiia bacterium]|nr:protein kinase [Acidimicrobiia bacterium]